MQLQAFDAEMNFYCRADNVSRKIKSLINVKRANDNRPYRKNIFGI